MITGRWGKPSEVLLDIAVDERGDVRGIVNPARQNAPISQGRFDANSGAVRLEGEASDAEGHNVPFLIEGRLVGRTLQLSYQFGELCGEQALVRVEEYRPPRLTLFDRLRGRGEDLQRWFHALSRPSREANASRLRARGETTDTVTLREAVAADIPALSELHVDLWNRTYRTTRGPTVATRSWQWEKVFSKEDRRDFVIVLEDRTGRLIGFSWGKPEDGEFQGQLSKIYLRWEYHGLGLGRRMMREVARRFVERGVTSFVLFAERSNPTIGFYDRMGGERLVDEKGRFSGAYAWRDARALLDATAP